MRVRDDNVRRRADRPLRNAPGVADQRIMTDSHADRHTDLASESAWSLCRPHTDRPNLTYSDRKVVECCRTWNSNLALGGLPGGCCATCATVLHWRKR